MIKVLVITSTTLFPTDSRPTGGIFFANLLKHLKDLVARIVVVSPTAYIPRPLLRLSAFAYARGILPHQYWSGIEVFRPYYLGFRAETRMGLAGRNFALAAGPLCERLHHRYGFDIVMSCGLGITTYAGKCVARILNLPCVSWAIGSDVHTAPFKSAENMRLLRHNVRYCDLVLTVSDAIRRRILQLCPGAGNVQTFYRGIDLEGLRTLQDRGAARRKHNLAADSTYVLSVGDFSRQKGVHEFYEAFRTLSKTRQELAAIWVGSGPEQAALRSQAEKDGLGDRFTVTGRVPRATVLELMQAADIMAFPSHGEGMPNVVVESLAAALPTVATDVGGTAEILRDGVTGILVPPRDTAGLIDGIERLLNHPGHAQKMAAEGRRVAFKYFDVRKNARLGAELLGRIAAGGAVDLPLAAAPGLPVGLSPSDVAGSAAAAEPNIR